MNDASPISVQASQAESAAIAAAESLKNPTFVIAMGMLLLAAATVGMVFWKSGPEVQNVVAGNVIGGIVGSLTGYYFGAAKHAATPPSPPTIKPSSI